IYRIIILFFIYQAEDCIRYDLVTGVQTCALPIFVSRDFLPLLFVNKFNVQLFAPTTQSRAASPGDDAGAQACRHRERKPLAVVCVERLDFEGMVVRCRRQRYATVGERTVHVHEQHGNLFGLVGHFRRNLCQGSLPLFSAFLCPLFAFFAANRYINSSVHKSCKCTTPSTRRLSSTTTTDVIFFFSIKFRASLASTCGPMVCGVFVMPSAAHISSTAPRCFSIKRRKSPSVRIPARRPSAST